MQGGGAPMQAFQADINSRRIKYSTRGQHELSIIRGEKSKRRSRGCHIAVTMPGTMPLCGYGGSPGNGSGTLSTDRPLLLG